MSILTKGALKVFDSKEGNYYYKIKRTKSSFNCNGELTGNDIGYIIPATLNNNGNLTTGTFSILPADNMTIELYRDDVLVLSSENVKNSENVAANEGEQTNIIFDLSRNNINISISEWGTVIHSDYSECAPLFINMRSSVIGIPANMIQIQSLINISSDYKHFTLSRMIWVQCPYDIFATHINTIDSVTL